MQTVLFEGLFIRSKQLLAWTRKKIDIIEAYVKRDKGDQCLPYVSAGEIYYAHLGTNIGSEIDKERPVLIFQTDDRFVRESNMAVIIPITSKLKDMPYRVTIHSSNVDENRGIADSSILVQQIRSISKARLSTLNGRLCEEKLREVEHEVNKLLYNSTPLQKEGHAQTVIADAAKT
jgi:mRNA-degrading endonuclease toxin of MazEF toxin-antitoxin module